VTVDLAGLVPFLVGLGVLCGRRYLVKAIIESNTFAWGWRYTDRQAFRVERSVTFMGVCLLTIGGLLFLQLW
jgi:hypothetical protein